MLRFVTCACSLGALSITVLSAGELRGSAKEPLLVTVPDKWQVFKDKTPAATFPFDTYRVEPRERATPSR